MSEEGNRGVVDYLASITLEFDRAYLAANKARAKGLDPEGVVEIPAANDLVDRVEKLVGPPGVGADLNELMKKMPRETAAFEISKLIMEGKYSSDKTALDSPSLTTREKEKRIEQAVRTGLALATEAIVSAPIEGVTKVQIRKNADSSDYAAVFFSGPIRGAGGTGQAFTLLIADYCRKMAKIADYRPSDTEVERYVEESNLYAMRTRAGQYVPTEDEVRHIMRNCPVCVDGEPTEHYEVGNHKNVPSIPTNKVRGGMCLVLSEGVCLKAAKVMKIAKKSGGLDWSWLEKLVKVTKKDEKATQIKPSKKYIDEIVAGRPIFSYPMEKGGFRLRYGRTALMGIMSKGIHPATSVILDEFPVLGTQLKIERPGKGCIVTYCEQIEGPTVLLSNGSVRSIKSVGEATALKSRVQKILFIGDLLCNYGDFFKSNHPLVGAGYCEEWYVQELAAAGVEKTFAQAQEISAGEAIELSRKTGVALAPKYSYRFKDITIDDLKTLVDAISQHGKAEHEWFDFKRLVISTDEKGKKVLEDLCIAHEVENGRMVLDKDNSLALLTCLGMLGGIEGGEKESKNISRKKFDALY
ncbi:DNA polymerase II large subunit, partial [Candidatus Micrarchaeota archaeon]|nr:DNA polymerase II large subunit [Candidatus Micrarchaeota archaeon]